jgi:hypothetical protein
MRRIALVVSVIVSLASCKRSADFRVDLATVKARTQERMERVMSKPAPKAALERLFAGVAADADVRQRGTALITGLGSDPAIAAPLANLMATAQAAPEIQRTVRELMAAHRGATAGEIGELVGKRVETNWETPAITTAWMNAWNQFLPKLKLGNVPQIFDSAIGARYETWIGGLGEHWGERITELNGGSEPTPVRAAELYVDRAWSEARIEHFLLAALGAPGLQRECITIVRQLLKVAAVRDGLRDAAAALSADSTEQAAAVSLISQLTLETPSADVIARNLDRMLQSPIMAKSINQLVARVLADPQVPKILVEAVEHLRADPQLVAAVEDLIDHW